MKKTSLNKNIAISVVLPAYNEEILIEKCLKNLQNQDFKLPYEIIVVNGPSGDKTKEIALKYTDRVVDQKGIGIGQARKQGCDLAIGEILAITDADVFVPSNWLTSIYEYFSKHKYIVAITGPYRFINSKRLNKMLKFALPIARDIHAAVADTIPLSGTNTAIRKDAYDTVGGFDEQITGLEDVELGIRLSKIGKVDFVKNIVVKTTDRRYKNPSKHIMTTLLPAYIKRTVLKTKDNKVIWKPIEDRK